MLGVSSGGGCGRCGVVMVSGEVKRVLIMRNGLQNERLVWNGKNNGS